MKTLTEILALLEGVKRGSGKEWSAKCPSHEDEHRSLSVSEKDGKLLMYCHAGCSFDEISSAIGIERRERIEPVAAQKEKRMIYYSAQEAGMSAMTPGSEITEYCYKRVDGSIAMHNFRIDHTDGGKTFRPVSQVDGGYSAKMCEGNAPLYRINEIIVRPIVWVVEGEKCVDALMLAGVSATTSVGGAQRAAKSEWSTLSGKLVLVWPDNDEPGQKYAAEVCEILRPIAAKVRKLCPWGEKKQDAFDWLAAQTGDKQQALIDIENKAFGERAHEARGDFYNREERTAIQELNA